MTQVKWISGKLAKQFHAYVMEEDHWNGMRGIKDRIIVEHGTPCNKVPNSVWVLNQMLLINSED